MAAKAKRFYKDVSVSSREGGFAVLLDARVLKTPGKFPLIMPREDMAERVAAEWEAQEEFILPQTMPCTRLMNVAVERTPVSRADVINNIVSFAETDQLCYRESNLAALARLQAETWDPILEWAAKQGVALTPTDSLIAKSQNPTSLEALKVYAADLDDFALTLMAHFTSVFSSAVLGLAVMEKHISASEGFMLSRVSEDWQIAQWGEDEEAAEITQALADEVAAMGHLIN